MTDEVNNITNLESSILSLQEKASFINEKIKIYNKSSDKKAAGLTQNLVSVGAEKKSKVQLLEEKLERELQKSEKKQKILIFMVFIIIILLSLLIFNLEINFI